MNRSASDVGAARSEDAQRPHKRSFPIQPRGLDLDTAGFYAGVSRDVIERLIDRGELSLIRLPGGRNGRDARRLLVDRVELDELLSRCRERRGG